MNPLTNSAIQEIKIQRGKGTGYKTIAKNLDLSPGTTYKYSKNIILPDKAKRNLLNQEKKKQAIFVSNFAKEKEIKYPKFDENFANLLGHLFFDGSVCYSKGKYMLSYTNSSETAITNFVNLLEFCFGLKNPGITKYKGKNIDWYEAIMYSKKAYNFLLTLSYSFSTTKNIGVPKFIFESNNWVKSSFLRAFWDDEGCISNKGVLSGFSNSKKMIRDLVKLHTQLGIDCYMKSAKSERSGFKYKILVRRRDDNFHNFFCDVGFQFGVVTKGYNIGKTKKEVLLEKIMRE